MHNLCDAILYIVEVHFPNLPPQKTTKLPKLWKKLADFLLCEKRTAQATKTAAGSPDTKYCNVLSILVVGSGKCHPHCYRNSMHLCKKQKSRTFSGAASLSQMYGRSADRGNRPFCHDTYQMRAVGTCAMQVADHLRAISLEASDCVS